MGEAMSDAAEGELPGLIEPPDKEAKKSDSLPLWTIRGVPMEMRNAANAAAKKDGMAIGEWLVRVIREAIKEKRAEDRRLPAVIQPQPDSHTALSDTQATADMMVALATAGVPISKRAASAINRALIARLPKN